MSWICNLRRFDIFRHCERVKRAWQSKKIFRFCESQNLIKKNTKFAESTPDSANYYTFNKL
ncbi:hypothetical protein [Helicobacter sp. 23-1045]